MKENRIIIAGSRSCPESSPELEEQIEAILKQYKRSSVEIVDGTARGADRLGYNIAQKWNLPVKRFPADWEKEGKRAGYLRNKKMAQYGTELIALWDGYSRGTFMMIQLARRNNLKVTIIKI